MAEGVCKRYLYALLLIIFLTGCAAPASRFKNVSDELFIKFRGSEAAALFPVEFRDVYLTLHRGDDQLSNDDIDNADMYYQLAIGKVELLKTQYVAEIKRREDIARLESEKRERAAAVELKKKQEQARQRAEETARVAAEAKRIAAEKAEARRKAERRPEAPPATTHTVKRGETLPQIAALSEVYGDSSLWPFLYKANRDQISNPAVLWPGQVLRIPRNYDRNELNEARRFSSDRQLLK